MIELNQFDAGTPDAPRVYRVPEGNLEKLKARIEKLARRALRLSVPQPVCTVLSFEDIAYTKKDGFGLPVTCTRRVFNVTVTGDAPKIAGWTFVAVLQSTVNEAGEFIGNVLRVVPSFETAIPERFRAATSDCEHCHTSRRRNETFVLLSDADEWKQVGRQCLRDFLGHTSPEAYATCAEILLSAADLAAMAEDDTGEFRGSRHVERFDAEDILTLGACAIRLNGFRSNATARENGGQSTSGLVAEWVLGNSKDRERFEQPLIPSDSDKAQASTVYTWLQALSERSDLNDYMYNLSLLGRGAMFETRNFGLALSAIPTWARECEQEINRRKRFEADAQSQYVGTPGERSNFDNLTLVYTQDFESQFGVTHFYKFKDAAGNVLVWFSSNVFFNDTTGADIIPGDVVSLVASVKTHEVRKDIRQTVITRAKMKPRELSKEEKTAIRKLKHILSKIEYCEENLYAHKEMDRLIQSIKQGEVQS